jgi:hypothetical protein
MFLYEVCYGTVDSIEIPRRLPTDNEAALELKAQLSEVYCLGRIILDNRVVGNNGSEYENGLVQIKVNQAFILLEKINSLHIPENDN